MITGTVIDNDVYAGTTEIITVAEKVIKVYGNYPYGETIRINEDDIIQETNEDTYWDR